MSPLLGDECRAVLMLPDGFELQPQFSTVAAA